MRIYLAGPPFFAEEYRRRADALVRVAVCADLEQAVEALRSR
jgi:nucleoside 2-deoxyribosyltransferase